MKKLIIAAILFFVLGIISNNRLESCTNLLVTKGASADGSTMITYNADAGGFMEPLYFKLAEDYDPNDSLEIYDWDTGKLLGKIKQVAHTYAVIGNMSEYQVSIGETTFGGRKELRDTNGLIDYGSLMWLGMHRAKTAREAIKIMGELVAEYGYYSSGESLSIADPNEVWIMDIVGKGGVEKGAVWVALRVPDGYVCVHANKSRISEFPLDDPENCLYAPDVISYAEKMEYYNPDEDDDFSFCDAYDPATPDALMFCEDRIWRLFSQCAPSLELSTDYFRAVKGAEPYPLWIKPDKKLSVRDVISLIRDHFEGTEFDMTKGLAAGPFGCPYRWKNLSWKITGDSTKYGWERPVSTQQTAFSFVSQMRSWMPRQVGGCFWYGVDDNYSTVYCPLYCSMTEAPKAFATGSIKEFSLESAFWVFNLVANLAYTKYSYIIKDIQKVQKEFEDEFHKNQIELEKSTIEIYEKDPDMALMSLHDYSLGAVEQVMERWLQLWKELVVKYNDGYINDVNKDNGRSPKGVGYGDEFLKKVIEERPGYYNVEWREE